MSDIRVRIAPSPSGFLHIGTARAALFNWLYARQNEGKFVVRIEDTDKKRSTQEMIQVIFDSLEWLGFESDEEPIYQSKRNDIYNDYINKILQSGNAYRCWCSPEELNQKREKAKAEKKSAHYDRKCYNLSDEQKKENLEAGKPFTVRLHIPEGETLFNDLIIGDITRSHSEIDDFIIARADGRAVYNLAVVVDDHEMGITHVIRGNDHITNTFKQILIYNSLGFSLPKFAHLPLILGKDKSKMSKRDNAVGVLDYAKMGFLKEAVLNFIALMGWSPGDDREILNIDEMIKSFSLDKINPSNAVFDIEKLKWMNGDYIRRTDNYILIDLLRPFLIESGMVTQLYINTRWDYMLSFVRLLKERCRLLTDFIDMGSYFFTDDFEYEEKGIKKYFSKPETPEHLNKWLDTLKDIKPFNVENIEKALRDLAEKLEVKVAVLIHPTRLALTGLTKGPSLFDLIEVLGKEACIKRIEKALDYIENKIK